MGEVYRARDRRLGREVALKVLPDETADDPDRLRRLEQEARAASSLNHPNVVVVYEIGEADLSGQPHPIRYIAMELLKGEPLSSALAVGALGTRRFLDLAVQLADGLAAAHDAGLIHRDLKPSNVIVDPEGRVKMLDFGLAKLVPPHGHETSAPTGDPLTEPGTVLGTIGYMAPEQVRGERATVASDQFSLGCIFYEMLTGRRAFRRPSRSETLSAILTEEPRPIEELNPTVPPPIRWVVERCLAKPPRERYASTHDLVRDLQKLREHSADPVLRPPLKRRRLGRLTAVTLGLALLMVGAASAVVSVVAYRLLNPILSSDFRRLTFRQGVVSRALFVRHSNTVLYSAAWEGQPSRMYLSMAGSGGLARAIDADVQLPMALNEDGSQALVLSGSAQLRGHLYGRLSWWPVLGGKSRPILNGVGWADWAPRGHRIVVLRDAGAERLLELRNAEGELERVLFRTSGTLSFPRFSPDEKKVAFIHHPAAFEDTGEVREVTVDNGESRTLTERFDRCFGLAWNPANSEVWFTASGGGRGSALWRVIRPGRPSVIHTFTTPFVLHDVASDGEHCLLTAESQRASLIVRTAGATSEWSWREWTMINDVSPDQRSLLFADFDSAEESPNGIWTRPTEGAEATRVADGNWACFTGNGAAIVVATSPSEGPRQLVWVPLDGSPRRALTSSSTDIHAPAWAAGRILFVREDKGKTGIWGIGEDGHGERMLADGCDFPASSPDGQTFLCIGGVGRNTLYLYPSGGGPGRVFFNAGEGVRLLGGARWNESGKALWVITTNRELLTLDAASGSVIRREALPLPLGLSNARVFRAAMSSSGAVMAYSIERYDTTLHLARFSTHG